MTKVALGRKYVHQEADVSALQEPSSVRHIMIAWDVRTTLTVIHVKFVFLAQAAVVVQSARTMLVLMESVRSV
jgi:hypothetical protein